MNGTRSRNNNVFHFSSYGYDWSRVLFHDTGFEPQSSSIRTMRNEFRIPSSVHTIELDLTTRSTNWRDRIPHANIRCHCTPFGHNEIIVGTLPQSALHSMQTGLTPEAIEILLHADLLPYVDFDKVRKVSIVGTKFADCTKSMITPDQYLNFWRNKNKEAVIEMQDVQSSYDALNSDWDKKIRSLTTVNGLNLKVTL